MKLQKIIVKGLFYKYNYDIELKKERITILHGPNGSGKTTIFRFLDALFKGDYAKTLKIPFFSFKLEFDDTSSISIYYNIFSWVKQKNEDGSFDSNSRNFKIFYAYYKSNFDFDFVNRYEDQNLIFEISDKKTKRKTTETFEYNFNEFIALVPANPSKKEIEVKYPEYQKFIEDYFDEKQYLQNRPRHEISILEEISDKSHKFTFYVWLVRLKTEINKSKRKIFQQTKEIETKKKELKKILKNNKQAIERDIRRLEEKKEEETNKKERYERHYSNIKDEYEFDPFYSSRIREERVTKRMENIKIDEYLGDGIKNEPPYLSAKIKKNFDILFIETQRLLRQPDETGWDYQKVTYRGKMARLSLSVDEISEMIEQYIDWANSSHDECSRTLERSFVQDVLDAIEKRKTIEKEENVKIDELTKNEGEIQKKVKYLEEIDLYLGDPAKELLTYPTFGKLSPDARVMVLVHQNNILKKLKTLEDLGKRLTAYKSIINDLFEDKEIKFSYKHQRDGNDWHEYKLFFKDRKLGININPNSLSSGEQHALILYHYLIFKCNFDRNILPYNIFASKQEVFKENVLVLIDEPEISLHLFWKWKFIDNLEQIIKEFLSNRNVEFILATHSMAIIENRNNLVHSLIEYRKS